MLKNLLKKKPEVVAFSIYGFQGKRITELGERLGLNRSLVVRVLLGIAFKKIDEWKNIKPQELQSFFLTNECANVIGEYPELRESEIAKEIFPGLKK